MARQLAHLGAFLALVGAVELLGCGKSQAHSNTGEPGDRSGGSSSGGTSEAGGEAGYFYGGTSGRGGSGAAANGGSSADAGVGGNDAGDAGEGGHGGGSSGYTGEGGDAGAGDDAGGGGGPPDETVSGRLIDYWRSPLADVPITIGTTTVLTNSLGEFTFADVAPEYDVSLVVDAYGWRFEGLTRRDPTLQVYQGRESRRGSFVLTPEGETLGASRTLHIAVAGPSGSYTERNVSGDGINSSMTWIGPATMQASFHGLLWAFDSNRLPSGYVSYDTTSALLGNPTTVMVSLNMPDEAIGSGQVSGSVTASDPGGHTNLVFVRFAGGAAIKVVEQVGGPDTYGYLVPTLPAASITVAATQGNYFGGGYALAHRDGLSAGQSGGELAIPTPAAQVAPSADAMGIASSTEFSWLGGGPTYIFYAEDLSFYRGVYVVTTRRQITLPTFQAFALRAAGRHQWRVETHGSASTVDALAGPTGYLDSFSGITHMGGIDMVTGPSEAGGSFSASAGRVFTTN